MSHKNFDKKGKFTKGNTIRNTGRARYKIGYKESIVTRNKRSLAISKVKKGIKLGICLNRRKREIRKCE